MRNPAAAEGGVATFVSPAVDAAPAAAFLACFVRQNKAEIYVERGLYVAICPCTAKMTICRPLAITVYTGDGGAIWSTYQDLTASNLQ